MSNPEGSKSGCPMHSYASTDLTYNDYLKIPELLSLQIPQSNPPHHDESLFIIIHQAYELWFKLILHEMGSARDEMKAKNILRAHHFIHRIGQIMKLLVQQIHILETMSPIEFLEFRDHLTPASGFQSIQFREIEFLSGIKDESYLSFFENRPDLLQKLRGRLREDDLRTTYLKMLQEMGFALPKDLSHPSKEITLGLLPIYQNPSANLPLYLLSESLIEFDGQLGLWREHHVRVVERVIGMKRGTGGSQGVEYLKTTTHKKAFPELWELRAYLVKA